MLTLPVPFVKMTTPTTGTGTYTLVAVDDFRALADFLTPSTTAYVECTIFLGTAYETGIYRLTASTTLERISIARSSNANAAVNWGAGDKTVVVGPAIQSALWGKHDFDSTPPSTADYIAGGWAQGSIRMAYTDYGDTVQHGRLWICRDGETSAVGVGRWVGVLTANGNGNHDGKLLDYDTDAPRRGSHALGPGYDFAHGTIEVESVVGLGWGGLAMWNSMVFAGHGWGNDVGEFETVINVGFYLDTANATPTKLVNGTDDGTNERTYLPIALNSTVHFQGRVTALASVATGGDAKTWLVDVMVKRGAAGDPAVVGTATITSPHADAGASSWDLDVGIDTANDGVYFEVTGEAATDIRWVASLAATKVAFA
jgi:hypothetical protein